MPIGKLAVAALSAFALMALSNIASAQMADLTKYCKADAERLCPGTEPGGGPDRQMPQGAQDGSEHRLREGDPAHQGGNGQVGSGLPFGSAIGRGREPSVVPWRVPAPCKFRIA